MCEDDDGIREVITLALRNENYEIVSMMSGSEIHSTIESLRPHIILIDLFLGHSRSDTIITEIKTRNAKQRVILMSGHTDLAMTAEKLGVEYLAKPFGLVELLTIVNRD